MSTHTPILQHASLKEGALDITSNSMYNKTNAHITSYVI